MSKYLFENGIISDKQCGFVKNKSIIDLLKKTANEINVSLHENEFVFHTKQNLQTSRNNTDAIYIGTHRIVCPNYQSLDNLNKCKSDGMTFLNTIRHLEYTSIANIRIRDWTDTFYQ